MSRHRRQSDEGSFEGSNWLIARLLKNQSEWDANEYAFLALRKDFYETKRRMVKYIIFTLAVDAVLVTIVTILTIREF